MGSFPGNDLINFTNPAASLFGLAFQTRNFASLITFLETQGAVQVLSSQRVAALNNRIPNAVLALEVLGAAFAFGLLALYTAMHGRGATSVVLAGALVTLLLLVIFDLDRPTRGLIRVPDTPLTALRRSMALSPAAHGP